MKPQSIVCYLFSILWELLANALMLLGLVELIHLEGVPPARKMASIMLSEHPLLSKALTANTVIRFIRVSVFETVVSVLAS